MVEAYKKFWQNALVLEGRTRRKDFWWPLLINMILLSIVEGVFDYLSKVTGHFGIVFGLIECIIAIVINIALFSLSVRRFHDVGRSKTIPMIMLVISLLSIVNSIFEMFNFDSIIAINNNILVGAMEIIAIIFGIFYIALCLICLAYCVQDREKGTNQYGLNPKEHMNEV